MVWFTKSKREKCCFEKHWYAWIPKYLPHRKTGEECEVGATILLSTCSQQWKIAMASALLTKFYNRCYVLFIIHWHTNFMKQIVFFKLYFKLINSPSLCVYMLWPMCRKQLVGDGLRINLMDGLASGLVTRALTYWATWQVQFPHYKVRYLKAVESKLWFLDRYFNKPCSLK